MSLTIQRATRGGVLSLAGTANQISVSAPTGPITLSLPQDIHAGAAPTFAALTLSTTPLALASGGTGAATAADARTALGLGTLAVLNTPLSLSTNASGTLQAAQFPALTGDLTTGAGALATTLATVNGNVGAFGSATQVAALTVNAKGLITAAANTTISVPSSAITDFLEAAQDAAGVMVDASLIYADATPLLSRAALTGDITAAQGGNATTLATVNGNVGVFGSTTSIPALTINAKGLITAASGNAVVAPAGTLTGTTLASGVTASSLTSLGTLTGLTINSATVTLSQDTNFVLSGGINGVSFDGTTLAIDGTNNYVGFGIAAPEARIHHAGAVGEKLLLNNGVSVSMKNSAGVVRVIFSLYSDDIFYFDAPDNNFKLRVGAAFNTSMQVTDTVFQFRTSNADRLKIDSVGNVGILTTMVASGVTYSPLSLKGTLLLVGTSSVQEREMVTLTPSYATSTDASRKSRGILSVYDTAAREALRVEASGTAAMIGFLGSAAAIRQTLNAAAVDAATDLALTNQIRAALITFGLCV